MFSDFSQNLGKLDIGLHEIIRGSHLHSPLDIFILAKIAQEKSLLASEKDIETMIQAVPDEKERQKLQSPDQKAYIASILRKRKTIDYLLRL